MIVTDTNNGINFRAICQANVQKPGINCQPLPPSARQLPRQNLT
jgi:hypothetical protein